MTSGKGTAGPGPGALDFRILGSFEVRRDGEALRLGGHRQRSVPGHPDAGGQPGRLGRLADQAGGYGEVFSLMVIAQLEVLRRAPAQVLERTAAMLERSGASGFRHLAAHVMRGWAWRSRASPLPA